MATRERTECRLSIAIKTKQEELTMTTESENWDYTIRTTKNNPSFYIKQKKKPGSITSSKTYRRTQEGQDVKVLIGCEFSGIVTKAFRDREHKAYSCDFLPFRWVEEV